MSQKPNQISPLPTQGEPSEKIPLFPGIDLYYLSHGIKSILGHKDLTANTMVIAYCKSGQMVLKAENVDSLYLGEGDFLVYISDPCHNPQILLPNEECKGISIYIDLAYITDKPPHLLRETGITGHTLPVRLFKDRTLLSFMGNEATEAIFRFFFNQPPSLQLSYQRIKTLELLLYLYSLEEPSSLLTTEYKAEQIETIRKIHKRLLESLDKRITIEELSRQYLMNPTTMKALFKSLYGTSLASHMKEHRMQRAAQMLLETEMTIAQIALAVGYDSQSKFSAAFKSFFKMLPKEYRKRHNP